MAIKPKTKVIVLAGLGTAALLALVAGIIVWQVVDWGDDDDEAPKDDGEYFLPPSKSELGIFTSAAVASDAPYCSGIGRDIFTSNGTVADATVATMLCVGLIQSQSMGLGGGFFAVYYDAATKTATTLNARERAPERATKDMFEGDPTASARGNLSVAVPGELKGYWELWTKYGRLPWKQLFEPTIQLARSGYNLTAHAANALWTNREAIKNSTTLAEIFVNPETDEVYRLGDLITRPDLAATLEEISNAPKGQEDVLYRGTDLMWKLVQDIQAEGGIITAADMLNYRATWDPPVTMDILGDFTVHSMPPPGSGLLLGFCLKVLSHYPSMIDNNVVTYQRVVESFKHAYAKRTILGDPESKDPEIVKEVQKLYDNLTSIDYINSIIELIKDDKTSEDFEYYGAEYYQPDDHGTAHMSMIAPNGDAIAITSTINLYYGSRIRSRQTGIIYNDEMDDFSNPNITNDFGVRPSKNNFIEPGKRPVSSMTPAIFTDSEGKVRLILGGAGGTKITTAVATVAMKNLWFNHDIKQAIDARRIHHQLDPMQVQYEEGFNEKIIQGLERIGHKSDEFSVGTSVIQGIAVGDDGKIYANSDFRKEGTVAGL